MTTARSLIERAEHALRTGQTENLFPVLARRSLEKIAEEKEANRREWEQLGPEAARTVHFLRMADAFRTAREAVEAVWENIRASIIPAVEALNRVFDTTQGDFAFAAPADNQE